MAHEGRPGHELQFARMIDTGVSVVRAKYALNSVNVEGWGLFAEDLVADYLPRESLLFALQIRLWRIARMFLDPQVNLGQVKEHDVVTLFTEKLGVSPEMASLEAKRYLFRDVGQAPAYYFGLLEIQKVLDGARQKWGKDFNLKCFNDSLLSKGAVPVRLVLEAVIRESNCAKE